MAAASQPCYPYRVYWGAPGRTIVETRRGFWVSLRYPCVEIVGMRRSR